MIEGLACNECDCPATTASDGRAYCDVHWDAMVNAAIAENIADGFMEFVELDEDGEMILSMTPAGTAHVEALRGGSHAD